jgi:hypothetical protein
MTKHSIAPLQVIENLSNLAATPGYSPRNRFLDEMDLPQGLVIGEEEDIRFVLFHILIRRWVMYQFS